MPAFSPLKHTPSALPIAASLSPDRARARARRQSSAPGGAIRQWQPWLYPSPAVTPDGSHRALDRFGEIAGALERAAAIARLSVLLAGNRLIPAWAWRRRFEAVRLRAAGLHHLAPLREETPPPRRARRAPYRRGDKARGPAVALPDLEYSGPGDGMPPRRQWLALSPLEREEFELTGLEEWMREADQAIRRTQATLDRFACSLRPDVA